MSRIGDLGLPGVTTAEEADLPAFLRRNVRSMNNVRPFERDAVVARMAERR
jgi:hypothetical protein